MNNINKNTDQKKSNFYSPVKKIIGLVGLGLLLTTFASSAQASWTCTFSNPTILFDGGLGVADDYEYRTLTCDPIQFSQNSTDNRVKITDTAGSNLNAIGGYLGVIVDNFPNTYTVTQGTDPWTVDTGLEFPTEIDANITNSELAVSDADTHSKLDTANSWLDTISGAIGNIYSSLYNVITGISSFLIRQ